MGFAISVITVNAEPISHEEFMKMYQPKIDKVNTEKLKPRKQLDLGILMLDVFCFDGKIRVLKFSDQNLVACVNPESAQKLVERGWGITKNEGMFTGSSHGTECGNALTIILKEKAVPTSTIIYKIRKIMQEFAEILLWQPIFVEKESMESLALQITGSYNLSEQIKLKDTLREIPGVLSIGLKQGGCV
jgi:hypothetical protein